MHVGLQEARDFPQKGHPINVSRAGRNDEGFQGFDHTPTRLHYHTLPFIWPLVVLRNIISFRYSDLVSTARLPFRRHLRYALERKEGPTSG